MEKREGIKTNTSTSLFYGSNETEKNTHTIKYINHKIYEVIWEADNSKVFALLIDKTSYTKGNGHRRLQWMVSLIILQWDGHLSKA